MTFSTLHKKYRQLTPQERFKLIDAAQVRDDQPEIERLSRSGQMVDICIRDYQPYAMAFQDVCMTAFMEAANLAGFYRDMMFLDAQQRLYRMEELQWDRESGIDAVENVEVDETDTGDDATHSDQPDPDDNDPGQQESHERMLAAGYVFRQKVLGWKLFCKRLGVPPFARWECLPGYERVMQLLDVSKLLAFDRKGILDWLNRHREPGEAEITWCVTARWQMKVIGKCFRKQLRWWGPRRERD
ncbi:MAG: hypothetical protein U0798_17465 [Gemmataceae bacterium]